MLCNKLSPPKTFPKSRKVKETGLNKKWIQSRLHRRQGKEEIVQKTLQYQLPSCLLCYRIYESQYFSVLQI